MRPPPNINELTDTERKAVVLYVRKKDITQEDIIKFHKLGFNARHNWRQKAFHGETPRYCIDCGNEIERISYRYSGKLNRCDACRVKHYKEKFGMNLKIPK